ncbi:MAG: hypothetical protein QNJ47_20045 [Nostocaceae cyanobacterium]|nr:hypothetical protein [Nostocaceae cyanobacterium]
MSQKASTHLIIPEPSDDLIASEPWSMETYADGLMDELFTDIDQILEASKNLPDQKTPPGYVPVDTAQISQIVWSGTSNQAQGGVPQLSHNQVSAVVIDTPAMRKVVKKRRPKKSRHWFGRLISAAVTLGLAIAGITWIVNSGIVRLDSKSWQMAVQKPQAQKPQLPTKAEIEANLADYMLGSLTAIDRQEASNQNNSRKAVLTASARTTPSGNLPPSRAANNTIAPSRPSTVVERVYIPVYQAPLPMRYAPPAVPRVPSVQPPVNVAMATPSSPSIASNPAAKVNKSAKTQAIKPVAVKTASIAVSQAKQPPTLPPIPSSAVPPKPPTVKAPAPSAAPEPKPPQQEVASTSVASRPHMLTGLLENGEKSLALFKINGADRRIQVGENIGSSGWTLVDVANGEAIIRRNGEVRSIFAGQKF